MQAMMETGALRSRCIPEGIPLNKTAPCRVTVATVMTDLEVQLGELEKVVIEFDRMLAPIMVPAAEDRERIEVKQDLPALVRAGMANVARLRTLREALASMATRALIES